MAENSKIQWTHHTFNPWIGCTKVSDLCKNCYAEVQTFARVQRGRGRELWGPNAERHRTSAANWRQPLAWNAAAVAAGERHRVFCASLSDVFEDRRDLDPWRADLWKLIEQTPSLDWLLLTKRPQNVRALAPRAILERSWVGYSGAEVEGLREMAGIPCRVRFLSLEPLIAPVNVRMWLGAHAIDWVIVGGESGRHARVCDLAWIRSVVAQCRAEVPVFVKQLGSEPFWNGIGNPPAGHVYLEPRHGGWRLDCLRDNKGGDPAEWPEDLRVREFPTPELDGRRWGELPEVSR